MHHEPDAITKFISAIIPATVAECGLRFNMPIRGTTAFVEKVTSDIVKLCDFQVTTMPGGQGCGLVDSKGIELDAEGNMTNHIQNLKLDLYDLLSEFKASIVDEVRVAIKEELRMEMYLELRKMKGDIVDGLDSEAAVLSMKGVTLDDSVPSTLASDPLFTKVTKSLSKEVQEGGSTFTIDDFITGRESHYDENTLKAMQHAALVMEENELKRLKKERYKCDKDGFCDLTPHSGVLRYQI